jgi:hypothetical protein
VSIGNDVGTAVTPASDLSTDPDSGALGLTYENAWPPFDLEGVSQIYLPNKPASGLLTSNSVVTTVSNY